MEKKYNFEEGLKLGVKVIVNTWPVLKFAIENGLATQNSSLIRQSGENYKSKKNNKYTKSDKEIRDDLINELYQYCLDYQVEEIDVQDFLLDYMDQHFFTVIEDNSEKLIAKFIVNLISDLEKGNNDVLKEILEKCEQLSGVKIDAMVKSDEEESSMEEVEEFSDEVDEEEEEEETEEEKQKREQLEADGWAVAGTQTQSKPKKKKQYKKNSEEQEELKQEEEQKQEQQLNEQIEKDLNIKDN